MQPDNIGENGVDIGLTVPEINIFNDNSEAEGEFEDVYDEVLVYIDVMGENAEYTQIIDTTGAASDAFTHAQFGYRLSSNETEDTYIGIIFETELPDAAFTDSAA